MHRITTIPRPSQVDDWHLVEKLEGETIKTRSGDSRFLEWKMAKAQEKIDKGKFEQIVDFESMSAIRAWVDKSQQEGKDTKGLDKYRKLSDLRWER